jgi:hypothetical protein
LTYTELIAGGTDPVEIVCVNWKNPITPSKITGFTIRTYDEDGDLLDKSRALNVDATNLKPAKIEDDDISISLSLPAASQVSSYTISFDVKIPIESTGECFVKYIFPAEIDISGLNLENI